MKKQHEVEPHSSYVLETNALLRGIAIVAVVTAHVLTNIPNGFDLQTSSWQLLLIIDQIGRFSVPLFVILSGYGFWEKYQQKKLHYFEFWWSQAKKLLPAYILISAVSYLIFLFNPHWQDPLKTKSFLLQLLLGKADYHLYFVPMIFQLYILFPIVSSIVKKFPWISLLVAFIFQIFLYMLYSTTAPPSLISKYLFTDQQQYFWCITWIFYFILGMHASRIIHWIQSRKKCILVTKLLCLFFLVVVIYRARNDMLNGINPITALRFTHVDTMLYATLFYFALYLFIQEKRFAKNIAQFLLSLGKNSYQIYLSHTMILRILFSI